MTADGSKRDRGRDWDASSNPLKGKHGGPGRGQGRKSGSKEIPRSNATHLPSACVCCGSTNRTPYKLKARVYDLEGETSLGFRYNKIVRRATSCSDCGEPRNDFSYEFDPTKPQNNSVD